MRIIYGGLAWLGAFVAAPLFAAPFDLLTGVDVGLWPGIDRTVPLDPVNGIVPGTFRDGDRLAGTSDVGPVVQYNGLGVPLFEPNHVGALSFLFRRGSVPLFGPQLPFLGVDFLGGPLLDLDGDLNNGVRSLVPVNLGGGLFATPIEIPGSSSHIDLVIDPAGGVVTLAGFDATGTNEGGTNIGPGIATILVTLAGTTPDGGNDGNPPNPAFDTRTGTLTPFSGNSGTLTGVYRIQDLQVELWYDSILGNSATASVLGTFQHFTRFGGWLVLRDCATGQFPVLTGEGLGTTQWPAIDTTAVGLVFNTAHGLEGGLATIESTLGIDEFTLPGNGGLPLIDGGGDLGAWLDGVVIPLLGPDRDAFVTLESAAFGINNSGDPIYGDTIGYDLVAIAAADSIFPVGDINGDGAADLGDAGALVNVLLDPASSSPCEIDRADVNGDGSADGRDVQSFLDVLL